MSTFIDEKIADLTIVKKNLSGGYKLKYLKYREKYVNLKNELHRND